MNKTINITSGDAEVCSCTEEDIKKYCMTVSYENACEKFFLSRFIRENSAWIIDFKVC